MANPLPLRPSIDYTPRSRAVVDPDGAGWHDIAEALGSETARAILESLADSPGTASDIAATVDTSLQNVQYHLKKLVAAGLVTEVGTWYSVKGREMRVYDLAIERVEFRLTSGDGGSPSTDEAGLDPPRTRTVASPPPSTDHAPTPSRP